MRIAIGIWILLLVASPTTVAAKGNEALDGGRGQARYAKARPEAAHPYPMSVDWRRKDGQDWTTPVKEASTCGACAAFGVIGAVESRLKIAAGDSSQNPDLSEAHLFFGSCDRCCDQGMTVSPALDFARDTGIVDEACYPYTPEDQASNPCAEWQDRTTTIAAWTLTTDVEEMKQALAEGGPIVASLTLYQDFMSYSGGIYEHRSGGFAGTHIVTLVGYDEAGGYWIGKNGWGTDWGEDSEGNAGGGGWFRISYEVSGVDDHAYIPHVGAAGSTGLVPDHHRQVHLFPGTVPPSSGQIIATPVLGGLHHAYSRTAYLH
jgi:C1A family cysteine protease